MSLENLDIDSKTVEELYEWYLNDTLLVNRRYQRKLVWGIDEKKALISSLIKKYPIPLLLFVKLDNKREILDGMQRLEAIMSFIEQRYDINGRYFALDSIALTKAMKDNGDLFQKEPVLSREESVDIARYRFAISEYSSMTSDIDEVFRRINSNGKTLSKQEIRSAGVITNFSELVRKISTIIRGDTTHSPLLSLNKMPHISISSDLLDYGINIENHFYVKNNIITKTNIRESADEELVAHILGYLMMQEKPTSGSETLDGFYGLKETTRTKSQRNSIDTYIQRNDPDIIIERYIHTYDELVKVFDGLNFKKHILGEDSRSHECPRYFQAVFLAFYQLIITEKQIINDMEKLRGLLSNSGNRIIDVTEGGRWASTARQKSVEDLVEHIRRCFTLSQHGFENKAWVSTINTILMNSKTEQPYYDFKQGIYSLDDKPMFSESCFNTILETCVAMNNISKDSKGYILIGIAENMGVVNRIKSIYKESSFINENGFFITGIDAEVANVKGGLDRYFQQLKQKIENCSMEEILKQQILKDIRVCDYKGKHIIKITINSVGTVTSLNNNFFIRQGANNKKLTTASEIGALFHNYS